MHLLYIYLNSLSSEVSKAEVLVNTQEQCALLGSSLLHFLKTVSSDPALEKHFHFIRNYEAPL